MLRRILLFIGIALVAMLLFITLATDGVIMNGFSQVERSFMMRNLSRAENAIADEVGSLGRSASDWAAWDDAYQFASDRNRKFIENNLRSDSFVDLHLNMILFLDTRGNLTFGETYDSAKGVTLGIPPALHDWLTAHRSLMHFANPGAHIEGIIPLAQGAILAAARPILTSRHRGPVHGALLLGSLLDADAMKQISQSLKLTVTLAPLPSAQTGALLPTLIDTSREDVVSGSKVLDGLDGSPALLVKVEFARDIHAQAKTTARYFTLWLIFIGVVFSTVVLVAIQITVLSRLQHLSARVLAIGTGAQPGSRVTVKGRDQIAYLGAAINGMLDALEGSHEELSRSEQRNRAFLDAIPDMIMRVTREGTIIDIRFAPRSNLFGKTDALMNAPLAELERSFPGMHKGLTQEILGAVVHTLDSAEPSTLEFTMDAIGGPLHFEAHIAASGDSEVIILTRETTSEKRVHEIQRQTVLMKEIHHRVKNNLQVISSLLGLQATATGDQRIRGLLEESRNRVRSVALIHEKLYRGGEGKGGGYALYVRDLADQLLRFYKGDSSRVGIRIDVEDIPMDMDVSVPVGLILNELLSNALAHAFPGEMPGCISVGMRRTKDDRIEVWVDDDGVGLPNSIDYRNPTSLGLRIVNMLAQQIRADLVLETHRGTRFVIGFQTG